MNKKIFVTRKFDELEGLYQGKFMGKYMMAKSQTEWFGDEKFRFYGFDNLNIIGYSRNWNKNSNGFKFLDMYDCKLIIRNENKSNNSTNDAKVDAKDDSKNKVSQYTYIDITDEMKDIGMLLFVKDIIATATVQCFQYFSLSAGNAKICLGKKGFKYPNPREIQSMFDDITGLKYTDFAKYINVGRFSFEDPEYYYNVINDIINDYIAIWKDYIKNEFDNNADNLYKKYDINAVNKLHPWEEIVPIKASINHMEPPKRNVESPKINVFKSYPKRRQSKLKRIVMPSFREWKLQFKPLIASDSNDVDDVDDGWSALNRKECSDDDCEDRSDSDWDL